MRRFLKTITLIFSLGLMIQSARGFALHGSNAVWQVNAIGYAFPGDIGGPMILGEEYRWNVPIVYYAYDNTFLDFFGAKGVEEVDKAIAIINALPPMSEISDQDLVDTARFPLSGSRVNRRAQALNLLDLKSVALALLVEELGLTDPMRYIFTLRERFDDPVPCIAFTVIRRNYDPVTLQTSSYINEELFTYIDIFCSTSPQVAWTVNRRVNPLPLEFRDPVAAAFSGPGTINGFWVGSFFDNLTRDDVGGLRYIYSRRNHNFEEVIADITGTRGGDWGLPGGTNTFITPAVRPGIDKISLVRTEFDALLGEFFEPITNTFVEQVFTNRTMVSQSVQRIVRLPDIMFTATDLNALVAARSANWTNNPALNGSINPGPGIIVPTVFITFNSTGPVSQNLSAFFLDELNAIPIYTYGSFDGSTNAPVVYPFGSSVMDLELQILGPEAPNPWRLP